MNAFDRVNDIPFKFQPMLSRNLDKHLVNSDLLCITSERPLELVTVSPHYKNSIPSVL